MASIYNKIAKRKNITYYFCKNRTNSINSYVIADLSKIIKGYNEVVVAWITKNKSIQWNIEFDQIIDREIIKKFIMSEL